MKVILYKLTTELSLKTSKLKTKFIEKFGSNFDGFLNGPNDPQESTLIKKEIIKKLVKFTTM